VSDGNPRTDPQDEPGGGGRRVQEALDRARLRRLGIRVLIVQVVALTALWLLQSRFGTP
jgi:hypothetical protein